jgi:hypothetical protein
LGQEAVGSGEARAFDDFVGDLAGRITMCDEWGSALGKR